MKRDDLEVAKRALVAAKKTDARSASLAYLEGRKLTDPRRREREVARRLLLLALAMRAPK